MEALVLVGAGSAGPYHRRGGGAGRTIGAGVGLQDLTTGGREGGSGPCRGGKRGLGPTIRGQGGEDWALPLWDMG